MKWDDLARQMWSKARVDEAAPDLMIRQQFGDDYPLGFHAQQAIEKYIKALLNHRQVSYQKTHDLQRLLDLCTANGIGVPSDVLQSRRLGPYAVEARYEDLPTSKSTPLDRMWAAESVRKTREWVASLLPPNLRS